MHLVASFSPRIAAFRHQIYWTKYTVLPYKGVSYGFHKGPRSNSFCNESFLMVDRFLTKIWSQRTIIWCGITDVLLLCCVSLHSSRLYQYSWGNIQEEMPLCTGVRNHSYVFTYFSYSLATSHMYSRSGDLIYLLLQTTILPCLAPSSSTSES
jgi:hypothetical protein